MRAIKKCKFCTMCRGSKQFTNAKSVRVRAPREYIFSWTASFQSLTEPPPGWFQIVLPPVCRASSATVAVSKR